MPLYKIERGNETRLVYAKTPRGAENHVLDAIRKEMKVAPVTPLEGAVLAGSGIKVETVGVGEDKVMADDPPEARRGFKPAEQVERTSMEPTAEAMFAEEDRQRAGSVLDANLTADLERLRNMPDSEIDTSDIPETDAGWFESAERSKFAQADGVGDYESRTSPEDEQEFVPDLDQRQSGI